MVSIDGVVKHHLTRGSFFGEVSLVYPLTKRSATVTAVTQCELASLSRADFEEVRLHGSAAAAGCWLLVAGCWLR